MQRSQNRFVRGIVDAYRYVTSGEIQQYLDTATISDGHQRIRYHVSPRDECINILSWECYNWWTVHKIPDDRKGLSLMNWCSRSDMWLTIILPHTLSLYEPGTELTGSVKTYTLCLGFNQVFFNCRTNLSSIRWARTNDSKKRNYPVSILLDVTSDFIVYSNSLNYTAHFLNVSSNFFPLK